MTVAALTYSSSSAQEIETVLMPGEVIAGHAEYEPECSSCHAMFNKSAQRQLCMDCHEDVGADIEASAGYHGLHPEASNDQCSSCHTEHEGRDAQVVNLDEDNFDHDFSDFEIVGAHLDAECADCHSDAEKHREAPSDCIACHRDDTPHEDTMGDDCASCHQSTEWTDAEFDHDTTDYPLIGKHQEAACLDCHGDSTFLDAPTTCFGCHESDDAHDGRSGKECENCHEPTDWNDSSFNHARDTEFPLEDSHAKATCDDCHSEKPFEDEMNMACVTCHLEDDEHDKHHGDQCDTCHATTAWAETTFDHDVHTDYELLGGHQEVACNDCHIKPIFEVELMTSCDACHLDDDPHEGVLGTLCESCHTEVNWQDPVFFDHDLTRFPLLGTHEDNECEDCHSTQAFANEEVACVSCHLDDDTHDGNFQDRCDDCHNPVGWDIWTFDHDLQTEFPLEGAHIDVVCDDCHRIPLEKITAIDGSCRNCHRADDVHDGEFGSDCGRCHAAGSFTEVRSLQ
ncbi:MAG: cytochrome C [Gammaproteobacteria bacterium]|nr:cytochrome C [Gammaproteobacteria bacterium]